MASHQSIGHYCIRLSAELIANLIFSLSNSVFIMSLMSLCLLCTHCIVVHPFISFICCIFKFLVFLRIRLCELWEQNQRDNIASNEDRLSVPVSPLCSSFVVLYTASQQQKNVDSIFSKEMYIRFLPPQVALATSCASVFSFIGCRSCYRELVGGR